MEKIAIYKLDISDNETDGIFVSLVDKPAIQEDWFYFSQEQEQQMMFFDDFKKMITGPVLIPNQKIFRNNINGAPAYVYFDEQSIQKSIEYFFRNGPKFDVMHNGNKVNVNVFESYITEENNKFNLPKGSWIITAKVNDENLFNDIRTGKLKGFSFKGLLSQELVGEEYLFKEEDKKEETKMEGKLKKVMDAITEILFTEEVVEVVETPVETKEEVQEEIVTVEESEKTEEVVETPVEETVVEETPEVENKEEVVENTDSDLMLKLNETIEGLNKKLEDLSNKFNDVNAKLEEYSKQPTSQTIVEEVTNAAALKQDNKINKAASFFTK